MGAYPGHYGIRVPYNDVLVCTKGKHHTWLHSNCGFATWLVGFHNDSHIFVVPVHLYKHGVCIMVSTVKHVTPYMYAERSGLMTGHIANLLIYTSKLIRLDNGQGKTLPYKNTIQCPVMPRYYNHNLISRPHLIRKGVWWNLWNDPSSLWLTLSWALAFISIVRLFDQSP